MWPYFFDMRPGNCQTNFKKEMRGKSCPEPKWDMRRAEGKYLRIKRILKRQGDGLLDESLRWRSAARVATPALS